MSHKSVITAAAVFGVVLAAGAAIGANIGLLSAADDGEIGSLSATGAPDTRIVDVDVAASTAPPTSPNTPEGVEFAVDPAGTVSIIQTAAGIRLGDVVDNPGWTSRRAQADAVSVMVTFTDGTRTLDFSASVGADGAITAGVNEPITASNPTAPDADHEVGRGDDEHDDDEHADEEHEGGDDDD